MNLDFTALDSLRAGGIRGETTPPGKAAGGPSEAIKGGCEGVTNPPGSGALNEPSGALKRLQAEADRRGDALERAGEVYRAYQENIKRSETLQQEILKGVILGEDVCSLFLKAAEAISLMTSNTVFYKQIEDNLRDVYGAGLREPQALNLAIQQAEERLERLQEAEQRRPEGEALERIRRAIKANREQIERLQE